jgi:hypothetical protein
MTRLKALSLLALAICLCSCGFAKTIGEANSNQGVEQVGDVLWVADYEPAPIGDDAFRALGVVASRLSDAVQAGATDLPRNVKTIRLEGLYKDANHTGADAKGFIQMDFDVDQLRHVKISLFHIQDFMNLASNVRLYPELYAAGERYCSERSSRRILTFCRNAAFSPPAAWDATTNASQAAPAAAADTPSDDGDFPRIRRVIAGVGEVLHILGSISGKHHHHH